MMEISYQDYLNDFATLRTVGVNETMVARLENGITLLFYMINAFDELEQQLGHKNATIIRLKEQLFGRGEVIDVEDEQSEQNTKTDESPADQESSANTSENTNTEPNADKPTDDSQQRTEDEQKESPGHGRLGADAYTGAEVIHCSHEHLKPGMLCSVCERGKLYGIDPKRRIVFRGQSPLTATMVELERLRCALCGEYFTATAKVDTTEKYTASAKSTLAILHNYMGNTYYGLERLQANLGMPIPASTQYEMTESMMSPMYPIFEHFKELAANCKIMGQDDTHMKILELIEANKNNPSRRGMHLSAFVSDGEHPIVLYIPGRNHAGENFDDIMAYRDTQAEPINRMSDALSANSKHKTDAVQSNCNAHGRNRFRSIASMFPEPCTKIVDLYAEVFRNERHCKTNKLGPDDRLAYHLEHSKPIMDQLHDYVTENIDAYEPNSVIYKELNYLLKHWEKLTRFLTVPGVWLDNNWCERLLKIPIKYRKNSLFFGTVYSASNHCILISIMATAQLNKANMHHYLTALQEYNDWVWQSPGSWMPWNYQATLLYATERQSQGIAA